ncbi:DEAD/DEAH box helicase family protein [Tenacibaculum sp. Bg11-29]|uniref:DEAD/DEAH box helicase family protein n=1 Tax=Tenacibaculum sp. Bg11-29 TaxID=2058306 RepID=UPI0018E3DA8E|nr:DEAD/DEAH box helicase family protein [Tenacibaculum sp. Bg11-29]
MKKITVPFKEEKEALLHFPTAIKFKYDWRKYQKRVLEELKDHLNDNHLHIIAPPGSGKTILGLEVALRLNKPTLIFAPTIAIRNQWIQRFCELFLQTNETPNWISIDIKKPQFLTVSTYQGLHAACSGTQEEEEELNEEESEKNKESKTTKEKTAALVKILKAQNIGTIVVDEAHHLKNAWWKSLSEIKNALSPTIVGLTATPPYDVSYTEWQRYIELNGPVDTEISVPELIIEGNLCPHQDYVFFSLPTDKEHHKIIKYRQDINALFDAITRDETLIEALEKHPIFQNPNEQLDWIYTNLEYYSATLIFLNAIGKNISINHLEVIGDKEFIIPELNYEWIEILLTFYLYKNPESFKEFELHQEKLINKLKRGGAMERRTVNFSHNRRVNKFLSASTTKLDSIKEIVDFEHSHLKQNLRMVILTDYIRKEFLIQDKTNELELNKIGVLPIFEKLRRTNTKSIKTGVLTGSLVMIPLSAYVAFKEIAATYNVDTISTTPLEFDNNYLIINVNQHLKNNIVTIITQVFQKGEIEVLVGTKSLLGEGWDAPAINALILASFVGSYVLSNQMRGRAIRTEPKNIHKTGNIWHLVCVDPTVNNGGDDMQLLKRRFKSFVGISFDKETTIENGIGRLNLPENIHTKLHIKEVNNRMLKNAGMREQLKQNWHNALHGGVVLVEEIKIPFSEKQDYKSIKSLYFNRTIKYLTGMVSSGVLGFSYDAFDALNRTKKYTNISEKHFTYLILFMGGLGVLLYGRLTFKTLRIYFKYRDISKDVRQIGKALLASLIKNKIIHTHHSKLFVLSEVNNQGTIYCHLEGGTTYEKSVFIKSLQEILSAVDNPRYLIIRKSFFLNLFSQKDYHSLPENIGRKKQSAEYFEMQWENLVGACKLVYTRTIEGRKLLLKSKIHSLASEFENRIERINVWK